MPEFDLMMVVHVACTILIIYNMCNFTVVIVKNIKEKIEEDPNANIGFDTITMICIYWIIILLSAIALTHIFSINGWVLSS